jgi:hypothetical protein
VYAVRAGYTFGRCCFADAKHAAKVLSIPNIKLLAEKKSRKFFCFFGSSTRTTEMMIPDRILSSEIPRRRELDDLHHHMYMIG